MVGADVRGLLIVERELVEAQGIRPKHRGVLGAVEHGRRDSSCGWFEAIGVGAEEGRVVVGGNVGALI